MLLVNVRTYVGVLGNEGDLQRAICASGHAWAAVRSASARTRPRLPRLPRLNARACRPNPTHQTAARINCSIAIARRKQGVDQLENVCYQDRPPLA